MKKIVIAFGTRPEIIKLAPVIKSLSDSELNLQVLHTGQHLDLVEPMLTLFDINPDANLDVMKDGQDLFDLTASLLPKLQDYLTAENPDYVIVQGDTSTAYITALSAYYLKIPVLHVEAGLRSHNPYYPFPEEANRTLISHLAHIHFAPTESNRKNLLSEGIDNDRIHVTGNTVIDALEMIRNSDVFAQNKPEVLNQIKSNQQLILLTAHRRENHGQPLEELFEAVLELVQTNEHLVVIYPAHPNPQVQRVIEKAGKSHPRFLITQPFDYLSFLHLINRSDVILTDSGGIQEEAAALGKPVLVLRNETERQELIESGLGVLVGTNREKIITEAEKYLKERSSINPQHIFGDGNAANVIKQVIEQLG